MHQSAWYSNLQEFECHAQWGSKLWTFKLRNNLGKELQTTGQPTAGSELGIQAMI